MNFVIRKGGAEHESAQIARQIADAIRRGEFRPGDKLPSVRSLKRDLGVAFNTVLRAYADLTKMRLVYSLPSKGVYVSPDAPPSADPESPGYDRRHFLALADAFIAQAERCGLDVDDALSELRLRARLRRKKAEAEELGRVVQAEIEESAKKAEAAEKARRKRT